MGLQDEVDDHTLVVDALGRMIGRSLRRAASEQAAPCNGADQSDEVIEDSLKTARDLRTIREQLENVTTGVILRSAAPSAALSKPASPDIG